MLLAVACIAIGLVGVMWAMRLLSPVNYSFLIPQLLFLSPFWTPVVFLAYALGCRALTIKMCIVFAGTELAAVAAMYCVHAA